MSALDLPAPAGYIKLLTRDYGPAETDRLLAVCGLESKDLASAASVTGRVFLRFLEGVGQVSGNPDWALAMGRRLHVTSHGPVGFAALSATDLRACLQVVCDYAPTRMPFLSWTEDQGNYGYRLVIRATEELGIEPRPVFEIVLQVLQALLESVLGPELEAVEWAFDWPRDERCHTYPDWFRGRLRFDAGWNGIELAQVLTGLPCPLHDEGSYRVSLARCRIDLERVLAPSDLPSRVRNLLGAHFDQVASGRGHGARAPQLPDLARQLHMSPRTLIRQLALQQSSYRELLEEQQCKLARELLAQARYRVADVGELLGFADPANFGRAFRRWTGQSPGGFRRS